MTAISLLQDDGGFAAQDPVVAIMTRIERARSRLRQERATPPAYAVFEEGRLVGAIHAPEGTPVFGPAAPTVLLTRETSQVYHDFPHLLGPLQPLHRVDPVGQREGRVHRRPEVSLP